MRPIFKTVRNLMITVTMILLSSSIRAQDTERYFVHLRYVHGQTLYYQYSEKVTIQNPATEIEFPTLNLEVKSDLKYFISKVISDGSALIKVDIQRFKVFKDDHQIADITAIPGFSGSVNISLNRSGEGTFYRRPFLLLKPQGGVEFILSDQGDLFKYGEERSRIKIQERGLLDEKSGLIIPVTSYEKGEAEEKGLYSFKIDILPIKLYLLCQLPNTALIKGEEKTFSSTESFLHSVNLVGLRDMGFYRSFELLYSLKGVDRERPLVAVKPTSHVTENITGTGIAFISINTGKLLNSGGSLTSEITIPGVGVQTSTSEMRLELKK